MISTASVQTSKHSRLAPFVWADTKEPVYTRLDTCGGGESDDALLDEKDYSQMTNQALKDLLVKLRDKYGIDTRITAANKLGFIDLVKHAVNLARVAAATVSSEIPASTEMLADNDNNAEPDADESMV